MLSVTCTRRVVAGLFALLLAAGGVDAAPFAFVPKSGTGKIAKVDLATGTTVADIVVPGGPLASTVSPDGQRVYAVLQSTGKVIAIDTASGTIVATITVGTQPWSATVSPDNSRLYVMNNASNTISVIDTAANSVIATMPVASQPQQLAISPDGTRGYLTASPNTVQVLDLVNRSVITSVVTGNLPNPILLDAAGTRAYIGYAGDSTIRVLDTATNAMVGSVALGTNKAPNGLALSPNQQTLYVSEFLANQAVEIDLATMTIGTTYTVGARPYGIDITGDGARVYVANRDGNSLSVIDTAAHAVTGTIGLGASAQPWAIGRFIQPEIVVAITSAPPPGGKWHVPYSFNVTATGAPAPAVSLSSGALPPGLALDTHVISGTPTQIGTYTGVLQAVSGSTTVTQPFSITIAPDWPVPPIIDSVVPGDGEVTVYFHPAPDDGNAPATMFNAFCGYASSSETSPIVVRGLPNGQPVTCTMNAINSAGGGFAGAPFAPVTPGIAPAFGTFAPPHATWNTPYSYTVTATGAPAPTLSLVDGSLPAGLTFDAGSGTISGTPTAVGSATVHLSATNALGSVTSGDLTIVVDAIAPAAPTSVVATPGDGQVSVAFAAPGHWGGEATGSYQATCSPGVGVATGNTSPLTVTGLANGVAATCSVSAVNSAGTGPATAAAPVMPGIAPAFGAFAPPRATWGASYSYAVTATGSPAPTLSLADGSLPAGLTFNAASGTISGTPTTVGNATVHLTATNALGSVTSGDLTIGVDAAPPAAPASVVATPGDGQVSIAFAAPAHWGGEATGSYSATCSPGPGVATGSASPLTVTGLANGVAVTCSVSAVNGVGPGPAAAAASVTPGVAPAFGAFAPPHATWGASYSYVITATGSPAPTLSIADGSLPAGLSFDAGSGTISGTPTAVGSATVHLTATNAIGSVTSGDLTVVVDAVVPAAPASVVATPGNGQVSIAFAAPSHWGGEAAGSYQATCSPGTHSANGAASPLTVTGLANGVAATCSVKAVNGIGPGPAAMAAAVTPRAPADLGVSITNGVGFIAGGGTVTYQIVVGNEGPSAVTGAQLVDEPGNTLTAITWTCSGAGGASCPAASGTGAIDATLNLPAGGSLHYTLSGTVPVLPETPLVHSVSVLAPNAVIDANAANDTAVDGPDAVGVFRDGFE
jgi:uncharacterized repeat protein (TIGR01451 family)